VVTVAQVRELALALPEATEQDHHGFPSFRVRGKIFATLPDEAHANIMIDVEAVDAVVAEDPDSCQELWWGKQVRGVRVELALADRALLAELLTDSWRRKAPRTLTAQE
jgi:hypothetical protein